MDKTRLRQLRCLVVDDEPLARKILQEYIEQTPGLDFAGSASNAFDANVLLQKENIEILFCDIKMPEMDGITFIRSLVNPPKVIFTTAFTEFGPEAFDLGVLDYLTKPISLERFTKAIQKIYKDSDESGFDDTRKVKDFLFFKSNRAFHKVELDDILFLEAFGNFVKIHTPTKVLLVNDRISALEKKLPFHQFARAHKSFLVGLNHISIIHTNTLEIGTRRIPIGEVYKSDLIIKLKIK